MTVDKAAYEAMEQTDTVPVAVFREALAERDEVARELSQVRGELERVSTLLLDGNRAEARLLRQRDALKRAVKKMHMHKRIYAAKGRAAERLYRSALTETDRLRSELDQLAQTCNAASAEAQSQWDKDKQELARLRGQVATLRIALEASAQFVIVPRDSFGNIQGYSPELEKAEALRIAALADDGSEGAAVIQAAVKWAATWRTGQDMAVLGMRREAEEQLRNAVAAMKGEQ